MDLELELDPEPEPELELDGGLERGGGIEGADGGAGAAEPRSGKMIGPRVGTCDACRFHRGPLLRLLLFVQLIGNVCVCRQTVARSSRLARE